MRFYYERGDQHLNMSGNLILSTNKEFITAPAKSAAPKTHCAHYVMINRLGAVGKLKATIKAIHFIWCGQ